MESLIRALAASLAPYLLKFVQDNRHILIDHLREESKKTDNKIDDFVVEVLSDYIEKL
jgi:hypothetical protein